MFHQDNGGDVTLLLLQGQGGLERCQRPGDTPQTQMRRNKSPPIPRSDTSGDTETSSGEPMRTRDPREGTDTLQCPA